MVARWFIEAADSVDITDDRWQILFLLRRVSKKNLSLAGYYTLYTFRNPFAGTRLVNL